MPHQPPHICGCGRIIAAGQRCPCQRQRDAERKARFDRTRPSPRERGYDSKWDLARKDFLIAHPLCVMCARAGIATPATVVDHIKPHRGDRALFWNRANWQPLCAHCHNSHKQRQERAEVLP